MRNNLILLALLFSEVCWAQYTWTNLPSAPFNSAKQDGIFFLNRDTGWAVNGSGRIFKTLNGGSNWIQQKNSPGTYFRAVTFLNSQIGFAGNVGPDYFPNVTDANPLYRSVDGGNSWTEVTASISGPVPVGICGIQALDDSVVYAAGRVGGPPILIKSTNAGETWQGSDLSDHCQMILDVWFVSPDTGFVFAGTSLNVAASSARILRTTDGGLSWADVYTSARPSEIMWKAWFPSRKIGYASIQSYSTSSTQRYIAKTINGGENWTELPLVNTGIREFGIGFINDSVGWVGGENTGYQTLNGGLSWTNKNIGQYANKFSIVKNPDGSQTAFAIGLRIFKMSTSSPTAVSFPKEAETAPLVYPNPAAAGSFISISLEKLPCKIVKAELISLVGKTKLELFSGFYPGTRESPFMFPLPEVASGKYIIRFTDEAGKKFQQDLIITN
jgi:photosystem II stability/assembly factor-like uncharacterized protein